MKNKSKFILVGLILLCLIVSAGAAYADDLDTIQEGEVSGGVDVELSNPGAESGELSYDIPEDVKEVQYAGLYVDCYTAGSSNLVYGSEANVSMTSNGETEQIANERLVSTQGSQDGTVYHINDHTTKCYADYYMTYNLTDKLQMQNGKITFKVNKDINVPLKARVKPINAVATIYGDYRNQLSVKCDDIYTQKI